MLRSVFYSSSTRGREVDPLYKPKKLEDHLFISVFSPLCGHCDPQTLSEGPWAPLHCLALCHNTATPRTLQLQVPRPRFVNFAAASKRTRVRCYHHLNSLVDLTPRILLNPGFKQINWKGTKPQLYVWQWNDNN